MTDDLCPRQSDDGPMIDIWRCKCGSSSIESRVLNTSIVMRCLGCERIVRFGELRMPVQTTMFFIDGRTQ
jgi:hypothetical protein